MKLYFILMCVLYLATMLPSGVLLMHADQIHWLRILKSVGDLVLFALCLRGAFGLAWNRVYARQGVWNNVGAATLVLGGFSVMLFGYGEIFGVPTPAGKPSLISLGLVFLPYVLFAAPVVIYEYKMKKGEIGQEEGEPSEQDAEG